ncbi:MAG TPA: Hsp33 family molecular chaperone HslO [Citrobacter freundii]|nr:Hsp33 family molecular chaperone HslO [Citrobacter freundii]
MMPQHDQLHRYLFENFAVRGELVTVSETLQQILENHTYPQPVKNVLAELLVATSLLTATLKFAGDITVQLQGDGPVRLAVINGDNNQQLRGVARYEGELPSDGKLQSLIGNGQLIITITPEQGERYQGIIALDADTLAGCLEHYFAQSEQLATKLWIRTGYHQGEPRAAGILLQALPAQSEDHSADFDHLTQLTATIKDEELFGLQAEEILYRLYHQDKVRVFDPQAVEFRCTCSRERCEGALLQIEKEEVMEMVQELGKIDMHCDYCGAQYQFNGIDVETLFSRAPGNDANQLH